MTKRAINRSYETMGMRQALLAAVETDIFIESSAGPERAEFNRIRKEQGLKAALAWRDARFKGAGSA
jgi:enoyl-CoA hydratase